MAFDPSFVWQLYAIPHLTWPDRVLSQTNIPAESPATNDCYLVGPRPVGEWIDMQHQIAVRSSEGKWVFQRPYTGRQIWVTQAKKRLQFDGRIWVPAVTSGLPAGGAQGSILAKKSDDDYDVEWIQAALGGGGGGGASSNVVIVANSENLIGGYPENTLALSIGQGPGMYHDRGALWLYHSFLWTYAGTVSQYGVPEGGIEGQVLVKVSNTNFDVEWADASAAGGDITAVTAGTGLTGGGTAGTVTLAVSYGTTAGTAAQGNDARLSNDRTASGLRTLTSTVDVYTAAAPSAGQVLTATSGSSANWQSAVASPVGSAGGDLGNNYPSPTVIALTSAASGRLSFGIINDGEFLQRSGTTIVSAAGASAPQPVQVNGSLVGTRNAIDLVAGSGITLNGVDDSGSNRVSVTITATGTTGGGGSVKNMYRAAPFSPDPFDDEFTSGSADLAVRGWTVINTLTGATVTRAGDVTNAAPSTIPTGVYRSTMTAGGLLFQSSFSVTIYKNVSGPLTVFAEIQSSIVTTSVTGMGAGGPSVWETSPPILNNSQRTFYVDWFNGARRCYKMELGKAYTQLASYPSDYGTGAVVSVDGSGNTEQAIIDISVEMVIAQGSGSMSGFTPAAAGFELNVNAATPHAWWIVKAFRKYPPNTWPGLT